MNNECRRLGGVTDVPKRMLDLRWMDCNDLSYVSQYVDEGRKCNLISLGIKKEMFKFKVDILQLHQNFFKWLGLRVRKNFKIKRALMRTISRYVTS